MSAAAEADAGRVGHHALCRRVTPRERKRIVDLAERGFSIREVSLQTTIPKSTIHRLFGPLFRALNRPRRDLYREKRVEMLEATEERLLGAVWDDQRLAKASLNNVAYTFTQIHTARRLESGQSTANLQLHQLVETVERDRAKRRDTTGGAAHPSALPAPSQVLDSASERA